MADSLFLCLLENESDLTTLCAVGVGLIVSRPQVDYGTNLGTKAEPQQIVAQRLLSCLQYPVP
jgi:hypothetical protein